MAPHKYSLFDGQRVLVDCEHFEVCCFRNCTLVYEGGEPPRFSNCSFIGCTWLLGRVTVNRIDFMDLFSVHEADQLLDRLLYAIRHHAPCVGSFNSADPPGIQTPVSLTI